jgi:hypothetical protein
MESSSSALESDFSFSRRQATVRRAQLGHYASDRTMTPVTFAPIGLGMGSVSVSRDVTTTQNLFLPESMSVDARVLRAETRRFRELTEDSSNGRRRTPEGRDYGVTDGMGHDFRQVGDGDDSVYLPGDFRYFMSTLVSFQENADRAEDQGNERELSSPFEQTRILSQRSPDPSLRINNGLPPIRLGGDVNGEQGVPNIGGIFHPSSGEYRVERGSRGAKAGEDIPDYSGGTLYRTSPGKVGIPDAVGSPENPRPEFDFCTFHDHRAAQEIGGTQFPTNLGAGHLFGSSAARPDPSISSGVVPERFRAGRESLSVIRNVTIRESKRPKARLQDHDYRRSSISPSMHIQVAPVWGPQRETDLFLSPRMQPNVIPDLSTRWLVGLNG